MAGASHVHRRVGYNAEMRWSLRSMFIATALVAFAVWLANFAVTASDVLYVLAIPILMGVGVGMLTGRVDLWVRIGIGVDILVLGAMRWL